MLVGLLFLLMACAFAQKTKLTAAASEHCTGMYNKRDWGGPGDAFIKIDLQSFSDVDPSTDKAAVSLLIFEYQDFDGLGVYDSDAGRTRYICTADLHAKGLCSNLDEFIVNDSYTSYADISEVLLTETGTNGFSYAVKKTGYYCVAAYNPDFTDNTNDFNMIVNFHNAFGSLPAAEIPLLPLYGLLAVIYAVCLLIYLFQVYKHRTELLLLQKYLAGFFVFLTFETIITWSLYDLENRITSYPMPAGVKVYIVFVSLLNSFKIAFSLFLLLIISLGYGIVYPKLSKRTMNGCKALSLLLFVFLSAFICLNYYSSETQPGESATDTSYSVDTYESDSWPILAVGIPLAILYVVFYFFILQSMQKTVKALKEQNQVVKLGMYKKLFRLLFISMLLIIFAFIISTIILFNDNIADSIEKLWKFDAALTNFWPSFLYLGVFVGIAIIWRPTDTSYLLAVSSQIPDSEVPEDEEENPENGFEFDDLGSLDGDPFRDPTPPSMPEPAASKDVDYDLELEQQKAREGKDGDKFSL